MARKRFAALLLAALLMVAFVPLNSFSSDSYSFKVSSSVTEANARFAYSYADDDDGAVEESEDDVETVDINIDKAKVNNGHNECPYLIDLMIKSYDEEKYAFDYWTINGEKSDEITISGMDISSGINEENGIVWLSIEVERGSDLIDLEIVAVFSTKAFSEVYSFKVSSSVTEANARFAYSYADDDDGAVEESEDDVETVDINIDKAKVNNGHNECPYLIDLMIKSYDEEKYAFDYWTINGEKSDEITISGMDISSGINEENGIVWLSIEVERGSDLIDLEIVAVFSTKAFSEVYSFKVSSSVTEANARFAYSYADDDDGAVEESEDDVETVDINIDKAKVNNGHNECPYLIDLMIKSYDEEKYAFDYWTINGEKSDEITISGMDISSGINEENGIVWLSIEVERGSDLIDLEIVAVFSTKAFSEVYSFKVSSSVTEANARFAYSYADDDDGAVEESEDDVETVDINIDKAKVNNGHNECPYLIDLMIKSYDEEKYAFDYWTINGEKSDEITISGMDISSGINEENGIVWLSIEVERGSDLIDLEIVAVFSTKAFSEVYSFKVSSSVTEANARFAYSYADDDDGAVEESEDDVETVDINIDKAKVNNGHNECPYLIDLMIKSYDEEKYAFDYWTINGEKSDEITISGMDISSGINEENGIVWLSIEVERGSDLIDLEIVAVFSTKAFSEVYSFKVSSSVTEANARFAYSYADDDDGAVEESEDDVETVDINIDKTKVNNGHNECPYLIDLMIKSYDEEKYAFDYWTINGEKSDEITISGMDISSGINEENGIVWLSIEVERGSDLIDLEIVAVFSTKAFSEVYSFKVSSSVTEANARFAYSYADDDDGAVEESEDDVETVDINIDKTKVNNGHNECPYLIDLMIKSYDEEKYAFDYWTINGEKSDEITISGMDISSGINEENGIVWLSIEVERGSDLIDLEIVAVFSGGPVNPGFSSIKLGDLFLIRIGTAVNVTTDNETALTKGDSVWEGQRAAIFLNREFYADNDESTVSYRFYAGEDTSGDPIASFDTTGFQKEINRGTRILIDPLPMLDKITAVVMIDGVEIVSKAYDINIRPSSEASMQWLTMPASTTAYPTDSRVEISGPNVYDTVAFTDPKTGALNLYLAVSGGIMKYNSEAATDLVWMDGMQFSYNSGEEYSGHTIAIGGDDADNLAAFVKETSGDFSSGLNISYCIYTCSNGTWKRVNGSELVNSYTIALVLSKDNIWVNDQHWNGTNWTANDITFNSFWKEDSKTAYAGSSDGIYKYAHGAWTKVSDMSGTMYISSGCRTQNGTTLIVSNFYEYLGGEQWNRMWDRKQDKIIRVDINGSEVTETVLDVSSLIATNASTNHLYVGIASDGTLYAITNGRAYLLSGWTGYTGSYLYKYLDGQWVYQKVEEFNNETDKVNIEAGNILGTADYPKQRPDGIRHIENPVDGVTVFAGQGGGNYIVFGTSTISFESNGGSEVEPKTGTICSKATPPTSPTREGYTFAGWYLSNKDIAMGNAPYKWTVMPATDITLYAKWNEKDDESSENPLEAEKEHAKEVLNAAVERLDQSDYDADIWQQILEASTAGSFAIEAATTYDAIYEALNTAIDEINELAKNTSGVISVAVTVEKLTVDGTYIIEPTLVECNKFEKASVVVTDLLKDFWAASYDGTPYTLTGTETTDFYLSGVWDGESMLSEFDYGRESGWMYCVNGSFPGVGASAWTLRNGDVMRWQYTCEGLGADIGSDNSAWGSDDSVPVADKDALIWRVAEINKEGKQADYGEAYTDAMTVLQTLLASQDEVDAALAALKKDDSGSSSGGSGSGSGNSENVTEQTEFTAEEIQEAAESGEPLTAETDQGSVTLNPETLETLAETEEDVSINLTENEDGSLTITVTAGDEDVTVPLAVALDVPADSLALAIVGEDGTETVIRKSWVENGVAHATIPAGVTVKAVKNAKSFIDVKDGNWFKGAVDFVSAHALFKGVSEDEFAPQSTMTRAMLVTVLYRLENEPKTGGVSFEDVAAGTWYTDAVAWAAENRIVLGDGTGFNPNGNVTREQIATILYRYVQYLGMEVTGRGDVSKFSDGADVSVWAQDAMAWAVKVGLFQGDDAGKLNPQGDATRAEVATLLERLVKFIVK